MLFKTLSKTESDPPMFGIGIVMSDGLAVVSSVGVGVGNTAVLAWATLSAPFILPFGRDVDKFRRQSLANG